jgi:hypothetical protein
MNAEPRPPSPAAQPLPASAPPPTSPAPAPASGGETPPPAASLTPEEQMALFEQELKETDWGHQPC